MRIIQDPILVRIVRLANAACSVWLFLMQVGENVRESGQISCCRDATMAEPATSRSLLLPSLVDSTTASIVPQLRRLRAVHRQSFFPATFHPPRTGCPSNRSAPRSPVLYAHGAKPHGSTRAVVAKLESKKELSDTSELENSDLRLKRSKMEKGTGTGTGNQNGHGNRNGDRETQAGTKTKTSACTLCTRITTKWTWKWPPDRLLLRAS